jgi:hypothetical protein
MKKGLLVHFLLVLSLFYLGLHLLVEERNFLKGYYPESFEQAGYYYNAWTLICALVGVIVASMSLKAHLFKAAALLLLSALVAVYAVFLWTGLAVLRVEYLLSWTGNYIILALFLEGYMLLADLKFKKY